MRHWRVEKTELISGLVLLLLGLGVVLESSRYGLGRLSAIGPGFFPTALGVVLVLCGLGTLVHSFQRAGPAPVVKWRALLAVAAALLVFALALRPLGLIPATIAATITARLAEPGFAILPVLVLAGALAVLSWAVFGVGLNLPLDAISWPPAWG